MGGHGPQCRLDANRPHKGFPLGRRPLDGQALATLRESAERASQRCVKLERQLNEARALTKVMWDQVVLGESRLKPAADAS